MAFIPKLALAIASGCAFLMLDHAGFVVASSNTENAMHTLLLLYGLAPCIIKILAAISLIMLIKTQGENDETVRNGSIQKRSNNHGTYDVS
jgi:Na+/melibiose symporter-like transporter